MEEFLTFFEKMNPLAMFIYMGIISYTLISISSTITQNWTKVRLFQAEADLKLEMLQRGMTAEQVAAVIQIHGNSAGGAFGIDYAALLKSLGEWGYESEEVIRIIEAVSRSTSNPSAVPQGPKLADVKGEPANYDAKAV